MSDDLTAALAAVVGDDEIRTAPADRATYALAGVVPAVVARPADGEALRACVAAIGARGGTLVALGQGAHRALGHAPARYDVALSCARLDRLRAYTPADMTVTVEAGMTVAALARVLDAEGQWLPLDPPLPDRTTIGGLVAADLGGALCASQGRVRDFVIGIAAVTAAGRLVHGGGTVVKNVAGYDLMKLLIGSLGTLAVVTEVTLKVRPRPPVRRCVVLDAGNVSRGLALAATLAAVDALALTFVVGAEARLVLVLGGVDEDVAVARAAVAAGAPDAAVVLDVPVDDPAARALLADVRDFVRTAPGEIVARVTSLPTRTPALAAALASGASRMQVDPRAGRTTLTLATTEPVPAIAALVAIAAAHDAQLVLERWPEALAGEVEVWRPLPAALPLMRRMKDTLDPQATLAPGRFVGRI